jgi:hypothetical protein
VTARTEDERLCENTWENGNRKLEVRQYKEEFDAADEDGTMFPLTLHPYLEQLIAYMKSKPAVWFATCEQITAYLKKAG